MSLILDSQGTYINSETGKYKFLINYETTEYLIIDISSSNVITINDKNSVIINTNFDTYSNDFAKLYKVKNNVFCNYLVFIQRNSDIGHEYIIIPLLINEGNILLPNIYSDYDNLFLYKNKDYFGFWLSIAPEIDGTLTSGENVTISIIGGDSSRLYVIAFQNVNEKLFLTIAESEISSDILFYIFNGETGLSENFEAYYLKNDYTIYDKNNNKINDNGFISFFAPYIEHEQLAFFLYKNYVIILTREANGIHICYAEIEGNNITDFGEITGLDYKGGFLGFSIVDDNYLYLNYSKDSTYLNSVDCYYILRDSTVVNFKVSYSEKHNLPLTSWWALLPSESNTFTKPITKITYNINKSDSLFGKNTVEFIYYSNEEIIIHSYVHFDNDYIPYQFILDMETYQIPYDETLQTIDDLNIISNQVINFVVPNYSITIVDSAGDTEDFSVTEMINLKQINRIITGLTIANTGLTLHVGVRFNDTTYEEHKYDQIAIVIYRVGSVHEFNGFSITGIIENGIFGQEYNNLNLKNNFTISIEAVRNYLIRFLDYDESVLETKQVENGITPTYTGTAPSREGYIFTGWTPTLYPANKNQDYTAVYEKDKYTITFEDLSNKNFSVTWWDTLTDEKSREFTEPIISISSSLNLSPYDNLFFLFLKTGEDSGYICTIGYAEKNIIPQNFKIGDTTYNIGTIYSVNINSDTTINIVANTRYFIRFLNYDNSILETKYVYSGDTPAYTGETPYRQGYTFIGWSPTLYPADKNQDYVAQFSLQIFTIRFLNDDGSVLETKSINYGETPTYTGTTPTKEGYTFNGWSPTLYPANKNQDYKATFRNNAFALTLYKNSAENNRIDKTDYLTSIGEITGYLREETNIINPSIVIEYDKVIDFNYVYISTFNRYYFVNNITSVRTNLWRLDMSCDVLMTYKETILNYECYVSRNENDYNEDIEDTYLPLEYEKVVEVTNLYDDTYNYGKVFLDSTYSVVFTTIYKGTEYKVVDTQVETEFQDLEGNILEVSSISLGASNYRCMGIIKNNLLATLNSLVEKTINDDTIASYIISLIVFPIAGDKLSNNNLNPEKLLIKDDETSISVTQGDVSYPRGGILVPVIANQFTIKPKYNNFLDYEPYTTYELYLPFYGWLKLNSYQILNEQLVVTYVPQVDSEQCTIIISKGATIGGSKEVIAEVTCQLGIQIPINSTNVERINREKTANTLNSIVGTISGVAIAGAGAVTGNPLAVVAGGATAIGSITSGLSKNMTMLPSAQSKTGSSYDGALGDRTFKLRITYPKIAVDDISKYAKYIGRPLQSNVKLNTLTGYTIVGGVHIENLDTATDNEKTDIENQLRKGVII